MTASCSRRPLRAALPLALALLTMALASCAKPSQQVFIDPSLSGNNILWVQPFLEAGAMQVHVRPTTPPLTQPKVVMFPFVMRQSIDKPLQTAREVTRLVWQTWLTEQVFPTLEFDETSNVPSLTEALRVAERKGADLVVLGAVHYLMDGGAVSDTMVGLQVDVYDVKSGVQIWSVTHAGRIEYGRNEDFILFTRKNRMPASPLYSVINYISWQMGAPIKAWSAAPLR